MQLEFDVIGEPVGLMVISESTGGGLAPPGCYTTFFRATGTIQVGILAIQ